MTTATAPAATTPAANLDSWGLPQDQGLAPDSFDPTDPLAGLDQFDGDGAATGGGLIDKEGAYHLEIADAEYRKDESGAVGVNRNGRYSIACRMVVLQSVPGQSPVNSQMWHDVEIPIESDKDHATKNGGNMFSVLKSTMGAFLVGVGLFRQEKDAAGKDQVIDPATGSTKWNLRTLPQRLKGLQFIGRPTREEWPGNETKGTKAGWAMRFQWGRGASTIGDPQNAMTPINEEAAKGVGLSRYVVPPAKTPVRMEAKGAVHGMPPANAGQTAGPAPVASGYDDL